MPLPHVAAGMDASCALLGTIEFLLFSEECIAELGGLGVGCLESVR